MDHADPQAAPTLVGSSAATRALDDDITAASRSDAKVLITGESGVGKDVAARLIHGRSTRGRQTMVTINCAGLPDSLLETELFGHVKGSFTDAHRDRPGLLQVANRGTIFLDEVGEMSLRMQALLLRFLETGEIQQVGADRQGARVDVRVICATHRDLRQRVRDGTFREDLFYRLNVVHIHILPIRERREDLRDLMQHFLVQFAEHHGAAAPVPTPEATTLLLGYDWPGNVRELRNVLERMVLRRVDVVTPEDLPRELRLGPAGPAMSATDGAPEETRNGLTRRLMGRMLVRGESFWEVVYAPFLAHDLTRQQLRDVIQAGLDQCQGRYNALTELFNMPKRDYRRFLGALKKFDCLVASPVGPAPETESDQATTVER
ncbi:MAG: sigma-54 dependent transcriptional regulator [Vicinamibacteraceae bacterium]